MSTSGLAELGEFEKALSVDQHGIEPIPESDRDSTSWQQFWIWFGANITPTSWVVGAIGPELEPPGKLLEIWQGELEAFHEEGCLQVLTMHPFLSGRPARSRTIGRFVAYARELGGVWFATAREVAEYARSVLDESGARRLRSALDPAYGIRDGATSADVTGAGP